MDLKPFRAEHLVQWNVRMCHDVTEPITDKVVEAVLYHQNITFTHTDEFRNLYSLDKLNEQLQHYDREYALDTRNGCIRSGLNNAFRLFAKPKTLEPLKPVKLTEAAKTLYVELGIKGDRSAGLTAYGESKVEAFGVGLDKAISILTANKAPAPCLAGIRTQRKGKTRLVWMYPLEMTILEAVVARPLIDYFKHQEHVMAFGDFSHEIGVRMRASASRCKFHLSIDYSQFDASVNPRVIHAAFDAFRTWYDLDEEIYPGVKLDALFNIIERYFICTPIVMPNRDGRYPHLWKEKRGGVPSGSYFTQIVDSFQNVMLIETANSRFKMHLQDSDIYVLGDDCLFFCNKPMDVAQISGYLSNFGFKLNTGKGSSGLSTDDVEFLGRRWRNGFPIRHFKELTRGALYPEKYRRYSSNPAERYKQALNTINSYLLTSYLEGSPVGVDRFGTTYGISWYASGFTRYLMDSGLIPGEILTRAIF